MEEEDQLRFGFDLFDPTKIVPEELVPITPIGKMQLNRNPRNYFAETEQVMVRPFPPLLQPHISQPQFQPGHIVRGIDFTEDPLLQGRLFSYLDTQLNRHSGPNFEQLPINRPRVPIHNNNRDGAGQMFIPLNPDAYTPNTPNAGSPKQANQTVGNGFFTAPRRTGGNLVRAVSSTFTDVWSQPRLFWNSLVPAEKQFVVDAMRFENANVVSQVVRDNVVLQLNRISNDLATRVAEAIGVAAPAPDPTFYHDNTTANVGAFGQRLMKLEGLKVGLLASVSSAGSIAQGAELRSLLSSAGVDVVVVGERMADGVNQTYSASDATNFDAVVVADGAQGLFGSSSEGAKTGATSLYPAGRPLEILNDAFRFGKTVGALGKGESALAAGKISSKREGVFVARSVGAEFVNGLKEGLRTFKFLDRFALDA
jgi:catalase